MPIASAGAPPARSKPTRGSSPSSPSSIENRAERRPATLQQQLQQAQTKLAAKNQTRLDTEIATLTTRYSGDAALAERVARGRMVRGFAASDPDFAETLAPIQAQIASLEEQIRKQNALQAQGTIGGSGGTLG